MPKASQISFNGGEYTEFMDPRVDVAKYSKGCRKMENYYPLPFGAAMSRPGTVHGGVAKYADRACRLFDFSFSTTTTFDIEVGHQYLRFWKDQAVVNAPTPAGWLTATAYAIDDYRVDSTISYRCLIAHTSGTFATDLAAGKWEALSVLEVASPYQESEIYAIQYQSVQDVIYLTHPNHAVRKLTRYADDDWRLSLVDWAAEFNYPPLADRNLTDTTIAASAGTFGTVGESITLTASADVFTADQVGDTMMIGHNRDDIQIKQTITATATSSSIYVLGDWSFQTTGTGVFTIRLQESADGGVTWTTKRQYSIIGTENNALATGSESSAKLFRIKVTAYTTTGGVAYIEVADPFVPGLAKITAVASATSATATVVEPLFASTATKEWAEQFFSDRNGHPRALCFHRNRLCLGSTDIWLSQPGNYENFRTRNDADAGFRIAINKSGSPFIQWLEDLRDLRVGTSQAEAVIISDNENEVFSYSNYRVRWDSNYGSKHLPAEAINGTALFLQPEGRTLRFQAVTGIEDFYSADTLTTLADHITGDGLIETAYQRQRYPTFHGVRSDGQVASLLYEASQNVQAWYRMVTDGSIESISVTPRPDEEDRVAYVVKRTVDGAAVRHIEFKALNQYRGLQDNDITNMWFVDDGKVVTGSAMTTVTGLSHLEGVTVAILGDGAKLPDQVVTGGQITIDTACDKVIVGRPYDMTLSPMNLESQEIMGRSKNISGAIVRLWRSGAGNVRSGSEFWSKMAQPSEYLDTAPDLFTGDFEKTHLSGVWDRNIGIEIRGRSPLPLNVMAITLEFEVGRG